MIILEIITLDLYVVLAIATQHFLDPGPYSEIYEIERDLHLTPPPSLV